MINKIILKKAIKEAIYYWCDGDGYKEGQEGKFSQKLISNKRFLDQQDLSQWLAVWMLSRVAPKKDRKKLFNFLNKVAIPELSLTNTDAKRVMSLAERGNKIFNSTQTSLFSKLAFSLRPDFFTPYDRLTIKALRSLDYEIDEHDYSAFLTSFYLFKKEIDKEPSSNIKSFSKKEIEILKNRIVDKYLMLLGRQIENK